MNILYVEDIRALRRGAVRELSEAFPSYTVLGAASVYEAYEQIGSNGGLENLALVCTDGDLIGYGEPEDEDNHGLALVERLRGQGYEGPVIYTSSREPSERDVNDLKLIHAPKKGDGLLDAVRKHLIQRVEV